MQNAACTTFNLRHMVSVRDAIIENPARDSTYQKNTRVSWFQLLLYKIRKKSEIWLNFALRKLILPSNFNSRNN